MREKGHQVSCIRSIQRERVLFELHGAVKTLNTPAICMMIFTATVVTAVQSVIENKMHFQWGGGQSIKLVYSRDASVGIYGVRKCVQVGLSL